MPPSSMTLPVPWPLPPEVPPALHAWRVPLRLEAPIPADDWAILSPAEADRAARLRQPADRVRSACTRAALRRLLGERIGLPPQDVPLAAGAHGRPALAGPFGTGWAGWAGWAREAGFQRLALRRIRTHRPGGRPLGRGRGRGALRCLRRARPRGPRRARIPGPVPPRAVGTPCRTPGFPHPLDREGSGPQMPGPRRGRAPAARLRGAAGGRWGQG